VLYKMRKQTVEPIFGIIKQAMRFRRFSLRWHAKVSLEWNLASTSNASTSSEPTSAQHESGTPQPFFDPEKP
jgi:hypothetical protein